MVRLTASPVDGEANAALRRFLGRVLDVPPSSIKIVRGALARDKLLRIEGATVETLRRRIEEAHR